jgi:hypothetical protein
MAAFRGETIGVNGDEEDVCEVMKLEEETAAGLASKGLTVYGDALATKGCTLCEDGLVIWPRELRRIGTTESGRDAPGADKALSPAGVV